LPKLERANRGFPLGDGSSGEPIFAQTCLPGGLRATALNEIPNSSTLRPRPTVRRQGLLRMTSRAVRGRRCRSRWGSCGSAVTRRQQAAFSVCRVSCPVGLESCGPAATHLSRSSMTLADQAIVARLVRAIDPNADFAETGRELSRLNFMTTAMSRRAIECQWRACTPKEAPPSGSIAWEKGSHHHWEAWKIVSPGGSPWTRFWRPFGAASYAQEPALLRHHLPPALGLSADELGRQGARLLCQLLERFRR
jgi:hypothetical protein